MNGLEIRERIDQNNKKIQSALNKFILTDEINQLMQENADLRANCAHEYNSDGFCIYCDTPIDFKEEK
jgi:hypothetical protein